MRGLGKVVNKVVVLMIVGFALAFVLGYRARPSYYDENNRRERFLPLIGLAVSAAGVAAGVSGADKKVQEKIWKEGQAAVLQPTYRGRQWDGADWSCPTGTVETGSVEDAKACITSQFHPPVWKWDGKTWGHHCTNGTVPTGDATWEKKCETGWTYRVLSEGKWVCPQGTEDSGKNWESPGNEGHKQCKRGRAYTLRINKDNKWVCPDGTKDTGRTWGQQNEWDQCKWTGP